MSTNRTSNTIVATMAMACTLAFVAPSAQATPVKVFVQEQNIVNAGTSLLGLKLLQTTTNDTTISQSWNVYVGSFDIGVASYVNGPFTTELAFCVDPWNWSGSTAMAYWKESLESVSATPPTPNTFDFRQLAIHETQIEALYSNYYQGTIGNTRNSAAFQLALWEIVSDNHVIKVDGTNQTIWDDGQSILNALNASDYKVGARHYDITAYYVDRNVSGVKGQNYLVATEVPEPASLALFGLGLASLGLFRQRKARL